MHSSSPAPGEPAPVRPPDHRPPPAPGAGCARGLGVGCGAFVIVALAGLAVVYFNCGLVVTRLEMNFVRDALRRSGLEGRFRAGVEQVFKDYNQELEKEHLGFGEWRKAASEFSRTGVVLVLSILELRASLGSMGGLEPEEKERAGEALDRLARGAAENKVNAGHLQELLESARSSPAPGGEKPRAVEVGEIREAMELLRILPGIERLVEEKGLPAGSFTPDIPSLLRRDLRLSLEAAKRDGAPP